MNNIPAHKNINNLPGQVVNHPKCKSAENGGCYCDGSCMKTEEDIERDKTLNDYMKRKLDYLQQKYYK